MRTTAVLRRQSGMTILELMIAMSLFVVLGVTLVKLVHRSLDFLSKGGSQGEVADVLRSFQGVFEEDVRSIFVLRRTPAVEPDVKLLSRTLDWPIEVQVGRKIKTINYRAPVFGFVRTIKGEEKDRLTRMAGSAVGGKAYYDGFEDEAEAKAGQLRPLGGLMEVLYFAIPEAGSGGGVLTLYRAYRSPIGGEGSLLDPETFRGPDDVQKIHAMEILRGVLHFDLRFWGGATQTWDDNVTAMRSGGGAYRTWDSTLGLLPVGRDEKSFPLAQGPESLTDPRDDLFPRRVRARLVLMPALAGARFARLIHPVGDRDDVQRVEIDPPTIVPPIVAEADRFLKVGTEWIEYAGRTDRGFSISGRGVRGTDRVGHEAGDLVYFGKTWEIQVSIPAFRQEIPK